MCFRPLSTTHSAAAAAPAPRSAGSGSGGSISPNSSWSVTSSIDGTRGRFVFFPPLARLPLGVCALGAFGAAGPASGGAMTVASVNISLQWFDL